MSTIAFPSSPKSKRSGAPGHGGGGKPKRPRSRKSDPVAAQSLKAVETRRKGRVTKNKRLLALLTRSDGASIEDMMQATDWQQHSVRGFLAGTVKKKLGLDLTSVKAAGDVRRYRIVTRRGR